MKKADLNFFPGWTRKAVTFTIDDGWLDMDKRFIDIVKPYGIKGAFNISSHNMTKHNDPELIRSTYEGFEITNHVKHHPLAFYDNDEIRVSPEPLSADSTDKSLCYPVPYMPKGVYSVYSEKNERFYTKADAEGYIALVEECKKELEEVFGEGSVRGFVWPYHRQENTKIIEYLKKNYYGLRDAGKQEPMEDPLFSLPKDRSNWHYNARHSNLLARAEEFEKAPDLGELMWFAFGVHSVDFDRAGNWGDLEEFSKKYGNRKDEFWYATNGEIFDYEDAVKRAAVTETGIENPSDIELYVKVDGVPYKIAPRAELKF